MDGAVVAPANRRDRSQIWPYCRVTIRHNAHQPARLIGMPGPADRLELGWCLVLAALAKRAVIGRDLFRRGELQTHRGDGHAREQ